MLRFTTTGFSSLSSRGLLGGLSIASGAIRSSSAAHVAAAAKICSQTRTFASLNKKAPIVKELRAYVVQETECGADYHRQQQGLVIFFVWDC